MHRHTQCLLFVIILCVFIMLMAASTQAAELQLSWDPPSSNTNGTPPANLAGYKLYYGLTKGQYPSIVNVGQVTSHKISGLTEGRTYYFVATAYDSSGNESSFSNEVSQTITLSPSPTPESPPLFMATFTSGTDGFNYIDDAFRNTNQASYASGVHTGDALQVTLGGLNDTTITNMSGGWRKSFTIDGTSATEVTVAFRYNLTQSSEYENDEYSDMLVTVGAQQPGSGGNDYVARLTGNGNGGGEQTTGWQNFSTTLTLTPGTYALTLGGYNNKKTYNDESTTVLIDDVQVTASGSEVPPPSPTPELPGKAFRQDNSSNGLVAIEAENAQENTPQGNHSWTLTTGSGFSGSGSMEATPNTGATINTEYVTSSPRLDFEVNFVRTGTHYVWVRGLGVSGADDSAHVGLNGQALTTSDRMTGFPASWTWSSDTMDGVKATFEVPTVGVHTVNVWMREDGFAFDKILLTTNANYIPNGTGPAESPRGDNPGTVHVDSFTVTPTTIVLGSTATLAWTTTHATAVAITPGGGTTLATEGSITVQPASTTTYTLTATGASSTATSQVTVTVTPPPLPTISSFSATPNTVASGQAVALAWTTVNATTVTIAPSPGNSLPTAGSMTVYPGNITTYLLTATGPGGSVTKTVMVTIIPPPIASFSASPASGTAPLSVSFTETSTGEITSRSWDFGNGQTSTAQYPTNIYQQAGTYTVNLTVTGPGGSHTHTAVITVTVPPPVANFHASTTSGNAPLAVTFTDASTGEISSHSWHFGDGKSSTVQHSTNIYQQAGTYTVTLTVTGPGGSQSTSATISVKGVDTDGDGLPDEEETTYGTNPQVADTDGDGINDGDEAEYWGENWQVNYDNDAIANNLLDPDADNDGYLDGLEIYYGADPADPTSIPLLTDLMTRAELQVDHTWQHVTFAVPFLDPVVVATPLSQNDPEPAMVRIRHVTSTGFDIRLQEWPYQDQTHALETVSYLVMERGHHSLSDGTQVEAGTFDTAQMSFSNVVFKQPFSVVPVVITAVASVNEDETVVGRIRRVSPTKFQFRLQEQDLNEPMHVTETVAYIAWEPIAGRIDGLTVEVQNTLDAVRHTWYRLVFGTSFRKRPVFLADMQTAAGSDAANLRWQKKTATRIDVRVAEEQSNDTESKHATEVVGYIAIH